MQLQNIAQILHVPVGDLLMLTSWANPELADPDSAHATKHPEVRERGRRSATDDTRATVEETERTLDSLEDRREVAQELCD